MANLRLLYGTTLSPHLTTEGGRTTPAHSAGELAVSSDGKVYRYVKNSADLAGNVNELFTYTDIDAYTVTPDISQGDVNSPAGVYPFSTQIAVSEWFWLQVGGEVDVDTETSSTVAAGEAMVPHASADGEATDAARGSTDTDAVDAAEWSKVFGYALATEVSGTPDVTSVRLANLY